VLSNGEKMRVDLAYCILQEKELIIFDEFTSVVNREVAKTGSYAISKAVKKLNKKFIAVGCHSDIIEWLEPDWIYNTDEQRFFFVQTNTKDQKLNFKFTELGMNIKNKYGKYSGNIII
jgi:ABC-type Mn2+/Zn2+ transport system ATPase subunit